MSKPIYVIESTHIYEASRCAACQYRITLDNNVTECHRELPHKIYAVLPHEKCDYFMWHSRYGVEEDES